MSYDSRKLTLVYERKRDLDVLKDPPLPLAIRYTEDGREIRESIHSLVKTISDDLTTELEARNHGRMHITITIE